MHVSIDTAVAGDTVSLTVGRGLDNGSNAMTRFKRISRPAYASAAMILPALVAWPSAAGALECKPVDEAAIKQLFVRWNAALQMPKPDKPNPNAVVNLYEREAVLLP